MTIINRELVQIYYGRLASDKRPGWRGIYVYDYVMKSPLKDLNLGRSLVNWKNEKGEYAGEMSELSFKAVVEGAAYNDRHGQVVLEEVRFGFFFALYNLGFDVSIAPPATIRKGALGHGRKTVGDLFPNLNHNAMDSLGCAMYALTL